MSTFNCNLRVMDANGNVNYLNPNTGIDNVSGLSAELNNKVDKISGKGLSTNDYTTSEKNKLADINEGAIITIPSLGTDYTLVSNLSVSATSSDIITLSAAVDYSNKAPRGIIISTSDDASTFQNNIVAKAETTENLRMLSCFATEMPYSSTTYYVWAKMASASSDNKVCLTYKKYKR